MRDRTRQKLVDTALRLFAERGYVGVRVEDIATEAGVSRATFYKHFAERDEILAELFGRLFTTGTPAEPLLDDDPGLAVRRLLDAAALELLEHDTLARFVYSLPLRHDAVLPGGQAVPHVFDRVRDVLDAAQQAGRVRGDVPLDRAMELLGRAFESAMRAWAVGEADDPRPRLSVLLTIVLDGLAATAPRPRRRASRPGPPNGPRR
jgi:AcrR family transcriptional regulator